MVPLSQLCAYDEDSGVGLMDIIFILNGSAYRPRGLINFAQLRMMSKCIDSMLKFQQDGYVLSVVPELRRVCPVTSSSIYNHFLLVACYFDTSCTCGLSLFLRLLSV